MGNHHGSFQSRQQRINICRRVRESSAVEFFNVLTGPELLETTEAHLPAHRERLYPPTVTLSMFMKQALEEDRSCQRAVNAWAAQRAAEGLSVRSVRPGAVCRARQRLPVQRVTALTREAGRLLSIRARLCWRWRGRVVKLVDGTGVSMPDTEENQAAYPQPKGQARGVGFPLARLVGVMDLSTGAVLEAAMGPHTGQGRGELTLFRFLSGALSPGDVLLGDALYCSYFIIATLQRLGVDVLFEQNGSRRTDFRRGERLASRDHLVCWRKPQRPPWMNRAHYETFPGELTAREVNVGGRILVTTMLDHRRLHKRELSPLYGRRWNIELDLRNIKTTLGMETLSCQTPPMVEKELWVYLLAYNLIRLLMAQAACNAGVHPRELSFKHTVQMWIEWIAQPLGRYPAGHETELFGLIAQVKVGNRPGRIEPRGRKRRPKPYPWLKVPRAEARRQIRVYGHLLDA